MVLSKKADEKSPLPSADRLSVSFIMGERDGSSVGTSSVRMDSPVQNYPPNQQPNYLDIGKLYNFRESQARIASILYILLQFPVHHILWFHWQRCINYFSSLNHRFMTFRMSCHIFWTAIFILLCCVFIFDDRDYEYIVDDEDEDEYSISAQSILQHRRSGGGRSAGKLRSFRRGRRPSSPFPGDEFSSSGPRRTSRGYSVATISSAELKRYLFLFYSRFIQSS